MRSMKAGDFGIGKRGVVAVGERWLLRQPAVKGLYIYILHLLLLLSCDIYLTGGLRLILDCQTPPPPPQGPGRVFPAPIVAFSAFPVVRSTSCAYSSDRIQPQTVAMNGPGPLWPRGRSLHSYPIRTGRRPRPVRGVAVIDEH